jgi:hypothetical protein
MAKLKLYLTGQVIYFVIILILTLFVSLLLIFVINPLFLFVVTGEIDFLLNDFDYLKRILRMAFMGALAASVVGFNISWFVEKNHQDETKRPHL